LYNNTARVREREQANRTRKAGHLDEIQGVGANTLKLFRNGAVGFIDWLGCGAFSSIPTEKQLRNAAKTQGANDCSDADPLPPGWSKRQKPQAISDGGNGAKDEKWSRKEAVNTAASGSVEQTRYTHDRERY
jgi:hypothetical protein